MKTTKTFWTNSRINKRRFWLPLLGLTIGATALAPAPAHAGLFSISEQEEIAAGKEVAQQAIQEYGGVLPPNDPMSVRVRALGQQFARLSTRKNIPYSYQVLRDEKVLNAFAAPGGPIFVTKRLVQTAANDAELAYVLGHETGHIERKHIVKSLEKQQQAALVAGVLGSVLSKGKTGQTVGALGGLAFTFYKQGYSRDQEKDSDIVGTRWMSQLGYDPQAAISMLGKLDGGNSSGFLDKYLATHPAPKERQATLTKLITDEKLNDVSRRGGGPRLWASGLAGAGYQPTTAPDNTAPVTIFPDNGTQPPPPPATQQPEELTFASPIIFAPAGKNNVVLAPVLELARWAGASASSKGNATIVERGRNRLIVRENSLTATINGQDMRLSVPVQRRNGVLYAPLGALASGIGGQAVYDGEQRVIWVTVDNQRGYFRL